MNVINIYKIFVKMENNIANEVINEVINEDEGVYLLHIREFNNTNKPIYKLGRSNHLENRVKQYPNGSKIMLMLKCKNSKSCENNLIKLFKSKFIQKTFYGTEYFEGNHNDMIIEIFKYIYNFDIVSTNVISNIVSVPVSVQVSVPVSDVISVDIKQNNSVLEETKNSKNCDRTCPKCKNIFRYPSTLKTHLESSSRCSMTTEEVNCFLSTIKKVIKKTIKPVIEPDIEKKNINNSKICKCCNKEFSKKYSLDRHLKNLKVYKNIE